MEEMTGRTFNAREIVETDGTNFTDCVFNSASLVYRGGEHPFFDRCTFNGPPSWRFVGPALKTIQLIQRIGGDEGGEQFIAMMFQKGKYFTDQ